MSKAQVFISSTFEDLRSERNEIIDLLSKSGITPLTVEESSFSVASSIERAIDEADYCLLVVGSRYGAEAVESGGGSFTEIEYYNALERQIPVFVFMLDDRDYHMRRNILSREDSERRNDLKLHRFRERLKKTAIVRYWRNQEDLKTAVQDLLMKLEKDKSKEESYIKNSPSPQQSIDLWIDIGDSDAKDIQELYAALSDLHRAAGGFGIVIRDDSTEVYVTDEVTV